MDRSEERDEAKTAVAEVEGVVENGRLTWAGVVVADIKDKLLSTASIQEIVSKRVSDQTNHEQAELSVLQETTKRVSELERYPNIYGAVMPDSEVGFLYTCAADILRMAGKRSGVPAALGDEIREDIEKATKGIGKKKISLENTAEYKMTDDEAAAAYYRYLEGFEPGVKTAADAEADFLGKVAEAIPAAEADLSKVWIVLGPGVGRDSHSEDVANCKEFLESQGANVLAIDWPAFKEPWASFKSQADWLVLNVLEERGIKPEDVIYYGHSKGDLIGRELAVNYPLHTYIGSCGPARAESDAFPTQIQQFLEATKREGNIFNTAAKLFPKLARAMEATQVGSEFHRWLLNNFDEAASVYLAHINAGKRWDELAKQFPPFLQSFFYYGDRDGIVTKVGRGASEKVQNATTFENPATGHKMIPNEMLLRLIKYAVGRKKELDDKFDPKRLGF